MKLLSTPGKSQAQVNQHVYQFSQQVRFGSAQVFLIAGELKVELVVILG